MENSHRGKTIKHDKIYLTLPYDYNVYIFFLKGGQIEIE